MQVLQLSLTVFFTTSTEHLVSIASMVQLPSSTPSPSFYMFLYNILHLNLFSICFHRLLHLFFIISINLLTLGTVNFRPSLSEHHVFCKHPGSWRFQSNLICHQSKRRCSDLITDPPWAPLSHTRTPPFSINSLNRNTASVVLFLGRKPYSPSFSRFSLTSYSPTWSKAP